MMHKPTSVKCWVNYYEDDLEVAVNALVAHFHDLPRESINIINLNENDNLLKIKWVASSWKTFKWTISMYVLPYIIGTGDCNHEKEIYRLACPNCVLTLQNSKDLWLMCMDYVENNVQILEDVFCTGYKHEVSK